ncbi:MAG: hypothetical protein V3T84_02440 [Phycisphaerales bacterium]
MNSVCLVLVFYGLTRGDSLDRRTYRRAGYVLAIFVLVFDGLLLLAGWLVTDTEDPDIFLQPWSVAAAMFAPFVVGRAFKLRYSTNSVWVLGCVYALAQPLAYGTAFALTEDRAVRVAVHQPISFSQPVKPFVSVSEDSDGVVYQIQRKSDGHVLTGRETRKIIDELKPYVETVSLIRLYVQLRFEDLVFGALALLKLGWAATAIAFLRVAPVDLKPNIRPCTRPEAGSSLFDNWKWFYWSHILALGFIFFVIGKYHGLDAMVLHLILTVLIVVAMHLVRRGRPLHDLLELLLRWTKANR